MNDIRLALAFLTRLPVSVGDDMPATGALARSMWAFPLVGVVTGSIGGMVFMIAAWAHLPSSVAVLLALAAMIATTGALHEDGLADMADATGGATRERKLEIMKDSRIGTYGVVALFLVLLIKAAILAASAVQTDALDLLLLLVSSGACSRAAIVAASYSLPSVRANGLSAAAGRPTRNALILAIVLALIIAFVALPLATFATGVLGCVIGAGATMALARQQIGGQTGDVLGACQQISEIGFLLGALVAIS
ncbi:MAG: adenosylcobinamide-GDP ribazoletransferase [Parvibaculaceae bacterium]